MRVLGIETSCDDTGIAVYDSETGLLAESLYSQTTPAEFGGVVPELASRDHIRKVMPMIKALFEANDIDAESIVGVAYTAGPGLMGALLVGASIGRSLAYGWGVPAIGVHHLEGHLLAPMLSDNPPQYPYLALLISGGHTTLLSVREFGQYEMLGETLDDAVGEAFDKTARLLGLSYPGGPELERLAESGRSDAYHFPRPMIDRPGVDFSFSGLKTFAMNTIRDAEKKNQDKETFAQAKADIAKCFQDAVVDTLAIKCKRAIKLTGMERLVVAGGVGANVSVRNKLTHEMQLLNVTAFFPPKKYCTDNGAMIAFAGCLRLMKGESQPLTIEVKPRWPLADISLS